LSSKRGRGVWVGLWVLMLGATLAPWPVRADILDADEAESPFTKLPKAKGEKGDPAGPRSTEDPGDGAAGKDGEHRGKVEPRIDATSDSNAAAKQAGKLKEPVAHAKGAKSGSTMAVIPPKNPGQPSKRNSPKGKTAAQEPVHFQSMGLNGLREKGMVELLQDVVVTQGEMKLESEHAQVIFDEASHEVRKVIADGKVRINGVDENSGDKFKAFGDKAVFLNSERTVVLEGNAKLQRGEDSVIRSRKITYEMNTGWIRADRVAGEMQAAPGSSKAAPAAEEAVEATPKTKVNKPAAAASPAGAPKSSAQGVAK